MVVDEEGHGELHELPASEPDTLPTLGSGALGDRPSGTGANGCPRGERGERGDSPDRTGDLDFFG